MGHIAKTVLKHNGEVIGIMPEYLVKMEVAFPEITELRIVKTMHERKAMMEDLSDAFIAMPGGFGTFEEIFEMITWAQLQLHMKPCGFLNTLGFYDKLLDFIEHAVSERFINEQDKKIIQTSVNSEELIAKLQNYSPVKVDKAFFAKANT